MSLRVTVPFFLLQPREVGRRSFSVRSVESVPIKHSKSTPLPSTLTQDKTKLTKKVLNQRPVRRSRFRVSESNYRRREFSQAELLHDGGESVGRVVCARVDLAGELTVGELLGGEQAGGPESFGRGEGRGVEEVVVAVVGV